jgi:hypothetical protein
MFSMIGRFQRFAIPLGFFPVLPTGLLAAELPLESQRCFPLSTGIGAHDSEAGDAQGGVACISGYY